jgi:hypothetical protein
MLRQRRNPPPTKNPITKGLSGTRSGFAVPMRMAAFTQKPGMLNIVIDMEIIVTNARYIRLGSNILLPNACGRSLISKGAVSAKLRECSI